MYNKDILTGMEKMQHLMKLGKTTMPIYDMDRQPEVSLRMHMKID